MDLFFADDASQRNTSRPGMGPLVAIGGLWIPDASVSPLEREIDRLCQTFGFPEGQEFKWSPGRNLWMARNLVEDRRQDFFLQVLQRLEEKGAQAMIVIDGSAGIDLPKGDPTVNAAKWFLERVDNHLRTVGHDGVVIFDSPAGDRPTESAFLARCLETLRKGTTYVKPQRIALNVLATHSHMVRLLQAADIVTSSTVAAVSGEDRYAPPIFHAIRPMLLQSRGRIGGVGLKLHPDYRYVNLYHWLVGDDTFWKGYSGWGLPMAGRPYYESPHRP
jgi:hypothetical protein